MVTHPIVSVVIPAYNHEDYVQEAIYSIINQSYASIELIVIDDGSGDTTWQKIEACRQACEARFLRTVLLHQDNEGRSVTLNRLIQQAEGEYVYIMASDDKARANAIETLVNFLETHAEYALAVGDNELIDDKGHTIYWDRKHRVVYNRDDAAYKTFGAFLQHLCGFSFHAAPFGEYFTFCRLNYIPNGYLVRSSVLKTHVLFTEHTPLEDYWMMLQVSKYGKMKYIDNVLFSYRWHQNNTVHNREYMQRITRLTWLQEQKNVQKPGLEKFRSIFEKESCRIIMKFRIGNLIKYYKEETIAGRRKFLEIMGRKFLLKDSTYLPVETQ